MIDDEVPASGTAPLLKSTKALAPTASASSSSSSFVAANETIHTTTTRNNHGTTTTTTTTTTTNSSSTNTPHQTLNQLRMRRGFNGNSAASLRHSHSPPRLARKDSFGSGSSGGGNGNGSSGNGAGGGGGRGSDETKYRIRNEINLTKEFIDFDVIKGSAFFHTKPANHDKKLVHQGFRRVLFIPYHRKYWRQKPMFYEISTGLYLFHLIAIGMYLLCPISSPLSSFEAFFPILLLLMVSIGYGRVSSALQAGGDTDPTLKLFSPSQPSTSSNSTVIGSGSSTESMNNSSSSSSSPSQSPPSVSSVHIPGALSSPTNVSSNSSSSRRNPSNGGRSNSSSSTLTTTTPVPSALVESDNSDSTDSDEDSGNSSSSSDEATPEEQQHGEHQSSPFFGPIASSSSSSSIRSPSAAGGMTSNFPTTPDGIRSSFSSSSSSFPLPANINIMFPLLEREGTDHLARRRVTVCVWENGLAVKKCMSITELRATILAKVKATPPRMIYRKIAKVSAMALAIVPLLFRGILKCQQEECFENFPTTLIQMVWTQWINSQKIWTLFVKDDDGFFSWWWLNTSSYISFSCMLSTFYMGSILFTALADAEVTYHRRFLYAKCFTALTSSRRSRLSNLPHFRLKNVVNIKAWISLRGGRSWLKRQGRQRAADEIVSTSFLINLVLLAVMGTQAVSENTNLIQTQSLIHIEVTMWCLLSSIFMLRFMMLGSNINKKYQNTSLLLTEQMNVYLRLLVKPHKKEKLLVSNNVLKLASKLLKELNSPNKISGITMNPLLYNITRVVVLSAFSSAASEFFGFKLKLWKMKV